MNIRFEIHFVNGDKLIFMGDKQDLLNLSHQYNNHETDLIKFEGKLNNLNNGVVIPKKQIIYTQWEEFVFENEKKK